MTTLVQEDVVEAPPSKSRKNIIWFGLGAIACFHLSFSFPAAHALIVGFLFCLLQLTKLRTPRQVFYSGLLVGFLIYAPALSFFWNIFHAAAIPLWLVLSFWLALFLLLAHCARQKLPAWGAALVIPFLWIGLEYFRSELYYLRFSWLSVGYAFSSMEQGTFLGFLGVYGIGFVLTLIAVLLSQRNKKALIVGLSLWIVVGLAEFLPKPDAEKPANAVRISGVQLEFREEDILSALERTHDKHPDTDIYVLSEYAFADPPSKLVRKWCLDHKTYLIAGGKDPLEDGKQFYNTAFVIGPDGEFIFKQVKSVPIQFFKDGLPAPKQEIWNSPWGKIGICICYDLSYRHVVDNLIAQGAQLLIVPTMDVVDWGQHQHELHARIAPMRASEYHIPIFRLCSSGISQAVDANGSVIAMASFPGQDEIMSAALPFNRPGRLPIDHWIAPFSVFVTVGFIFWLAISKFVRPHQENT